MSPAIHIEQQYPVPVDRLWAELRQIDRHVNWMADAASITFQSEQREGLGTEFLCVTKVGPIKLTDVMTITSWENERAMGVRHSGIVTGEGTFTLTAQGQNSVLSWDENLSFPWWMGGKIGEFVAKPILTAIWRGNLRRLATFVE
jgi:hypothetical protein